VSYDEQFANRVRNALSRHRHVTEKKMFGGVCFMVSGHMACGIVDDRLMVRLAPAAAAMCLTEPHVTPMDFTGRPLKGFLFVGPGGTKATAQLRKWIERAVTFAESLPPPRKAQH
jgi:hypothetical protein